MKVLVCGSRSWTSAQHGSRVHLMLTALAPDEIIQGGATGADNWAWDWADENHVPCHTFPADWATYGRRAGIIRNLEMLDQDPDLVVAFWDGQSTGTHHTITEARKRGVPVKIVQAQPQED